MARVLWCAVMLVLPVAAFADPRVATPTFSVGGGEHQSIVFVVVRVNTPGATIRLTQNGLDPAESDPIIVSGSTIAIRTSLVLKARAFLHGRRPSAVRTAAFTITEAGPAIGPGDAAAGGARSVVVTPDGRVFEWRNNSVPRTVAGLSGVTSVAVGRHVMALTKDGDVYAWGANNWGQLGDGTCIRRERPIRVLGLSNVVRIAAGRTHSLAVTADGRVWAWGSNSQGQLGITAPQRVRVPTLVPALSDIVSIEAGNAHAIAMTRAGDVWAWGANNHGQLGDGSRKRRTQPVRINLTDIAQVATGATHTLALTRDGTVYSWGSGARGELGTGSLVIATRPVAIGGLRAFAIRAGRHFSAAVRHDGVVMTWGANESGQLGDGSLVDRSAPVLGPSIQSISTLSLGDRHVIAVTTTGDVWTWGRNNTPSESMSDVADWGPPIAPDIEVPPTDRTPPTIVAAASPPPSGDWYTTPVTVSFQCADDSGTVSCPDPVVVSGDGASQLISGTATDPAGNHATATVTISIDRTPPSLVLTNSPDGTMTTVAQRFLTGRVSDSVSGAADILSCNGAAVPVFDEVFECILRLEPGVNSIILAAADVAGNVTTSTLVITRVVSSGTLRMTPDTRTMLVDDVAPLSLHDETGAVVLAAEWASSDIAVVTLSDDDPPVVRAHAPGSAVIIASKDGSTAASTITVDPGDTLAPGAIRWTIAPTPGFTMEPPIFTHRVDPAVPDMFIVETRTFGVATLRAVTSEGELLWSQESPGIPLMGDSFGGVIAGVPYAAGSREPFKALVRLGEAGDVPPWRYESGFAVLRPAQAADGTIYAVEYVAERDANGDRFLDRHAIVIDGRTGIVIARHLLARDFESYTATLNDGSGGTCASMRTERAPEFAGPIVGSDGRGYLVVRHRQRHDFAICLEGTEWPERTIHNGVDLMILSRDAAPVVHPIYSEQCHVGRFAQAGCDQAASLQQVVPDGIGGMLVVWSRGALLPDDTLTLEPVVTRRDADGATTHRVVPGGVHIVRAGQNGIVYASLDAGYSAIDAVSWTPTWTSDLGRYAPVAAHPDGGAAIYNGAGLSFVSADGQVTQDPIALGLGYPIVQEFNSWIGLKDGQLHVLAGEFPDATRFATAGGNTQQQSAVRKPGLGIFLKSHLAERGFGGSVRYRHLSLRIVPKDQERWKSESAGQDPFGNWYFTFGAGPVGGDTDTSCGGTLVGGLNRGTDVTIAPYDPLESIPHNAAAQNTIIQQLFNRFNAYRNNLPYACFPENNDGFYNSNSYAAGLLNAVALRVVGFPTRVPELFPGVRKPVPADKFQ